MPRRPLARESLPNRRSIRLPEHDYTGPCWYHVTICAACRGRAFGRLVGGAVILSPVGRVVRDTLHRLPAALPWIRLDRSIVMPDHIHFLIRIWPAQLLMRPGASARRFGGSQAGALSLAVNLLKGDVTRLVRQLPGQRGRKLWHRGYHERIIRTPEQMAATRAYIRNNPARG